MKILRYLAQGISVLFHPLLMLTYITWLFLVVNPYLFGVSHWTEGGIHIARAFQTTFVLPAVGVLIMKGTGLISSLQLENKQERIGPYILAGVFYIWFFVNNHRLGDSPNAYNVFILGATLSLFASFLINIFFKISAHTVGIGGLIGMLVITMRKFSYETFQTPFFSDGITMSMTSLLMIVLVIAGVIGSARLYLGAHRPAEVYSGYLVGFFLQFVALLLIF